LNPSIPAILKTPKGTIAGTIAQVSMGILRGAINKNNSIADKTSLSLGKMA
jgi:hypothetical protein